MGLVYMFFFVVVYPLGSMYGIFTQMYHKHQPNVDRYSSPMEVYSENLWPMAQVLVG